MGSTWPAIARLVRSQIGESQKTLALRFDVSESTMSRYLRPKVAQADRRGYMYPRRSPSPVDQGPHRPLEVIHERLVDRLAVGLDLGG